VHPDEARDAVVARAREQARVEGRLNTLLSDGFASARATNGIADPHVTAWGHALEAALNHSDGGTLAQLGVTDANAVIKLNYQRALASYGKTGDPGLGAPGRTPLPSEHLAQMNAPMETRMAAQAVETQQALAKAMPLFTVTLDLVQAPSGVVVSAELLTHSGNARFDDFVLTAVPSALTHTAPPPRTMHAAWEIEGWLQKDANALDTVANFISLAGPIADQLATVDASHAHFEYRARLVRAY
jgi:hypothetical protein